MSDLSTTIAGQPAILLPERAVYLPQHVTLLVSDLHFGKASHFRKAGIGVPAQAEVANLSRLSAILGRYPVQRLVLLGDAFHSSENGAVSLFAQWRSNHASLHIDLVLGNHDVLPKTTYGALGIQLYVPTLSIDNLTLIHDPAHASTSTPGYPLGGHIHPGLYLPGKAGGLTLPALIANNDGGILPAFGTFTGCTVQTIKPGGKGYVFTPERVFAIPAKSLTSDKLYVP